MDNMGTNGALSFSELRCKEVINIVDGKRLGKINDILFSKECARVLGFVVPGSVKTSWFKKCDDVFIPYCNICKIGIDVILVQLRTGGYNTHITEMAQQQSYQGQQAPMQNGLT